MFAGNKLYLNDFYFMSLFLGCHTQVSFSGMAKEHLNHKCSVYNIPILKVIYHWPQPLKNSRVLGTAWKESTYLRCWGLWFSPQHQHIATKVNQNSIGIWYQRAKDAKQGGQRPHTTIYKQQSKRDTDACDFTVTLCDTSKDISSDASILWLHPNNSRTQTGNDLHFL